MLDRLYHRLSARSGFTLVELLVVLIVISVLLGFTTVRVTSAIDSARVASTKAQVRNAFTVAQSNYADNDQVYVATQIETEIEALGGDYATVNVHTGSPFDSTDVANDDQLYIAVGTSAATTTGAAATAPGTGDFLVMAIESGQNAVNYCYMDNEGTVTSGELAGTSAGNNVTCS